MSKGLFSNKYFTLCVVMQLMLLLAFHMAVPLIAKYVVYLGESATVAGIIAGMFALLALAYRPFSGFLTDRVNKKVVLTIGFICTTVSFFGYAFSQSAPELAVFRAIHAFGLCVQTSTTTVVATMFVEQEHVAEATGYMGMASVVGMAIGPSIGVWLADTFGYFTSFVMCGCIMLILFALLAFLPIKHEPVAPKKLSVSDFVDIPSLSPAIVIAGFGFCAGLSQGFLALMGEQRGIPFITVFFLIAATGMVFTRPWGGRMVDQHGPNSVVPASFASEVVCMVLTAFSYSIWPILVAAVARTFGQGMGQTSMIGYTIKDAPPEKRGVVSSTIYMGVDVGQGVGAMAGGALIDIGGFTMAYLSGAVVITLGAVLYYFWQHKNA